MVRIAKPFENQFRWEVDRWVFRFRQRGTPVEVAKVERERLIALHTRRTRIMSRAWFGGAFAGGLLVGPAMSAGVPQPFVIGCYFGMAMMLGIGLRYWADQAVTLHLRKRLPVGEKLGFMGAWMMRAEVTPWPQLLIGCAMLPLVVSTSITLPEQFSAFDRWLTLAIAIVATAALAALISLKLLIEWRDRRRGAWRKQLDEIRDLRID